MSDSRNLTRWLEYAGNDLRVAIILNKTCSKINKDFLVFEKDFAWLSTVYIESRYPDDFEDIDKEDALTALSIANSFEQVILTKFES